MFTLHKAAHEATTANIAFLVLILFMLHVHVLVAIVNCHELCACVRTLALFHSATCAVVMLPSWGVQKETLKILVCETMFSHSRHVSRGR